MKRLLHLIMLFWVALSAFCLNADAADKKPTLAIVFSDTIPEEHGQLITASLTEKEQYHVLEREELGRLASELRMETACDSNHELSVCVIAGADVLAIFRRSDDAKSDTLFMKLLDVGSGKVLWTENMPYDTAALEQHLSMWKEVMIRHMRHVAPRPKNAKALSITGVHIVAGGEINRKKEKQLTSLLMRTLADRKEFLILERLDFALLMEERAFGLASLTQLWPAQCVISASWTPALKAMEPSTLDVVVKDEYGIEHRIQRKVMDEGVGDIAALVAQTVMEALTDRTGSAPRTNDVESGQFAREAKWALRMNRGAEARIAADIAWHMSKSVSNALLRVESRLKAYDGLDSDPDLKWAGLTDLFDVYSICGAYVEQTSPLPQAWYDQGLSLLAKCLNALRNGGHEGENKNALAQSGRTLWLKLRDMEKKEEINSHTGFCVSASVSRCSLMHGLFADGPMLWANPEAYADILLQEFTNSSSAVEYMIRLASGRYFNEAGLMPLGFAWSEKEARIQELARDILIRKLRASDDPECQLTGAVLEFVHTEDALYHDTWPIMLQEALLDVLAIDGRDGEGASEWATTLVSSCMDMRLRMSRVTRTLQDKSIKVSFSHLSSNMGWEEKQMFVYDAAYDSFWQDVLVEHVRRHAVLCPYLPDKVIKKPLKGSFFRHNDVMVLYADRYAELNRLLQSRIETGQTNGVEAYTMFLDAADPEARAVP